MIIILTMITMKIIITVLMLVIMINNNKGIMKLMIMAMSGKSLCE